MCKHVRTAGREQEPGDGARAATAEAADERLATAFGHWSARFVANGADAGDVQELARTIRRWDDWCAAWSRVAARHEALGRAAACEGRGHSAGQHLAQAAATYHFGRFLFVHRPGEQRVAHDAAVRCLNDALEHLDPPGRRVEVPFAGGSLAGVLRLPDGPGTHPVVVLVPGLDSTKEELRLVELPFLERGLGTFAVDGPGQGEAEYALAIRPDWEVPIRAVVDHLGSLPDVDGERIGLWGVSLGGYYAPRGASGDDRVRACIALAGPYSLGPAWDGLPELTRTAFRVRSHAAATEEARERATALTLEGRADAIRCPLLVVFGKQDRLFPWQGARRLAEEAPQGELLLLEHGNHGCANVVYQHRPYAADWMAEKLAAARP